MTSPVPVSPGRILMSTSRSDPPPYHPTPLNPSAQRATVPQRGGVESADPHLLSRTTHYAPQTVDPALTRRQRAWNRGG